MEWEVLVLGDWCFPFHPQWNGKLAQHLLRLGLTPGSLTKVKKAHNSCRGEMKNNSVRWHWIGQVNVN